MEIEIAKLKEAYELQATNDEGLTLKMDASEDIGGKKLGMRPMQVLLSALGGCASIDVLSILDKQKQKVDDYCVVLSGERREEIPKTFTRITLTWKVTGQVDEAKLKRAIDLSLEKYCSVTAMISPPAEIDYHIELNR